jgi:hypothetical protein
MTPLQLAQNLAKDPDRKAQAMGIAIVARSLSDDTEDRQGWPLDTSVKAAAKHLGLFADDDLINEATRIAPTLSDATLNRSPR